MLKTILSWFRGRKDGTGKTQEEEIASFRQLDRNAPLRSGQEEQAAAVTETAAAPTYLSREAILGRDQRIAGYQFLLHEGTRNRIRHSSRRVHHLYAEVLIRNLVSSQIGKLLGHRFALLELPDSFFDHPCLAELPAANIILMPRPHRDEDSPSTDFLHASCQRLRQAGFRIALPDPMVFSEYRPLLDQAQLIVIQAAALDVQRGTQLNDHLRLHAPQAGLLVRELPLLEHFQLAYKLGSRYFQGPFITSREHWDNAQLGPNTLRLSKLISRLRADGDTAEIAALLKQDGALALRLLRSVNSAAYAYAEPIASIEHALIMLGRERLYRWLVMLAFTSDQHGGRASAALETALVRGRMLELLGASMSTAERESLFLVGLLSLADVIMQLPLVKVLGPLALPPQVNAALLEHSGPYHELLQLAIACERENEGHLIEELATRCEISPKQATQAHMEALLWALEIQQEP